jgi:hypothetical protein
MAEQELEAVRYYELIIDGQALMRFNTGCDYSTHPDGVGGAQFYTKLIVAKDALDFTAGDPLTVEVRLQPDDVLALVGTTD